MPSVDKYDTQSAIELLRQSIDHHGWCACLAITLLRCCRTAVVAARKRPCLAASPLTRGRYDKHKILQKEVSSTQYVACLNPTAGSFFITPRMQRHFATFAVQMPTQDVIRCGLRAGSGLPLRHSLTATAAKLARSAAPPACPQVHLRPDH